MEDAGPTEPAENAAPARAARELQAALAKAARTGRLERSGQALLFEDEATLIVLDRLEMMISDAGLRGVAPEVMAETAHAVRTIPIVKRPQNGNNLGCFDFNLPDPQADNPAFGITAELPAMIIWIEYENSTDTDADNTAFGIFYRRGIPS